MTWVFAQDIRPSHAKFVLVSVANCANENGLAWPSIAHICDVTSQDRKTVIKALQALERTGHIEDTGERKGSTKQIKVYQFRYCSKSTEFPIKESRVSSETVPSFPINSTVDGTRNPQEPKVTHSEPKHVFGLDVNAWETWVEYRKKIRKPLKQASIPAAQKQMAALGSGQMSAVEHSIANSYQGLFAKRSGSTGRKTITDYRAEAKAALGGGNVE
jgi:hypothetical protein